MHCSSLSSFRHAAGRTCTDLKCHRSPWEWKITCTLLKVSTQKWLIQLLLKFYWPKHITWLYPTQRTWGSIMLHMSKKKIRIFTWMFQWLHEVWEELSPPRSSTFPHPVWRTRPSLQARALTQLRTILRGNLVSQAFRGVDWGRC